MKSTNCPWCIVPGNPACPGMRSDRICGQVRDDLPGRRAQCIEAANPSPQTIIDNRTMALATLAARCPHGSGACGCGAEPRDCSHPDHDDKVWIDECLSCVEGARPKAE